MTIEELVQHHRDAILQLALQHGARSVRIFGSVARGTATDASDIDVLVELEPGRSLLDLGALLIDLEQLLEHRVGIVTEQGLRARIRERVLREAVPL